MSSCRKMGRRWSSTSCFRGMTLETEATTLPSAARVYWHESRARFLIGPASRMKQEADEADVAGSRRKEKAAKTENASKTKSRKQRK